MTSSLVVTVGTSEFYKNKLDSQNAFSCALHGLLSRIYISQCMYFDLIGLVTIGYHWLPLVTIGYSWLLAGYPTHLLFSWLSIAFEDNIYPSDVISSIFRMN